MHAPIIQPCPLDRDEYIVKMDLNSGQLVIAGRDNKPINGAEVEAVLGEREPAVIWNQPDRYDHLVFGPNFDAEDLAQLLADQLNACVAEDAARDAELIDAAAEVAERIEQADDAEAAEAAERIEQADDAEAAEAADGLSADQRRGLAAYKRAVVAGKWYRSYDSAFDHEAGDRITIGAVPPTDHERGAMIALQVPWWAWGKTATVILPAGARTPMIVLTDDRDEVVALPSHVFYVRPVAGGAA